MPMLLYQYVAYPMTGIAGISVLIFESPRSSALLFVDSCVNVRELCFTTFSSLQSVSVKANIETDSLENPSQDHYMDYCPLETTVDRLGLWGNLHNFAFDRSDCNSTAISTPDKFMGIEES